MKQRCILLVLLSLLCTDSVLAQKQSLKLTPHKISLANGKTFNLNLPPEYEIMVAAEGLKRVRFMAKSPDGRIFVTDMFNLTDNKKGAVYILDQFDERNGRFGKVTPYMTGLRNPNSICFHIDRSGQIWFYLALTDKLVRYRFTHGEEAPSSEPQILATFPDYGLGYKYGGWHLTRTVAFGPNGKLYVSVGSSCNACEEKEEIRATVLEMNADGTSRRIYARGLRNAVGIKWVGRQLFATNMGADHLGNDMPEDTMYILQQGANYGWPYCYQHQSMLHVDPQFKTSSKNTACTKVPRAYATFGAHTSPLGFEYFATTDSTLNLKNSFLVALHGSSDHKMGHGHSILRVKKGAPGEDFINGFIHNGMLHGRPVDIMKLGHDTFLFTDDHAGVIYYVRRKGA